MKSGIELIADERQRQVSQEGWTPEHDDGHNYGEMARAAQTYLIYGSNPAWTHSNEQKVSPGFGVPSFWPWSLKWWKPSEDPIRNLVKAGALIAAEIDRLQRLNNK